VQNKGLVTSFNYEPEIPMAVVHSPQRRSVVIVEDPPLQKSQGLNLKKIFAPYVAEQKPVKTIYQEERLPSFGTDSKVVNVAPAVTQVQVA